MTSQKDMNKQRDDFGITYDDKSKQVYVFGGYNNYEDLEYCEKYFVEYDLWTELKPMTKKKSGVSACMFNS